MNPIAHICLTYFLLSFIIPETQKYLIPIAIFASFLDIDHIYGLIKLRSKKISQMKPKEYISQIRTFIQEPIGIIGLELLLLIIYLFFTQHIIVKIAAISIVFHWFVDFLTVHSRPFTPFNNKIYCFFFDTYKQMVWREVIITTISIVLFIIAYFTL